MKNYIVANANRRLSEHDSEQEAITAANHHNANCRDYNTEQASVLPLDEYVDNLEAAVRHMEFLHAEQKAHMKRHNPNAPVTPKK